MTESSASRTRADARTVIADLLYQHHTGGDIVNADEFLAALRSHGYAVVPVEPTDDRALVSRPRASKNEANRLYGERQAPHGAR